MTKEYQCSFCRKNKYNGDSCPLDYTGMNENFDTLDGMNRVINSCGCGSFVDSRVEPLNPKMIWERIVKMGSLTDFTTGSPEWCEATRCRIAGYLRALDDAGLIDKKLKHEIFSTVWLWYKWNKKQLYVSAGDVRYEN